jgi:hypothetical protein
MGSGQPASEARSAEPRAVESLLVNPEPRAIYTDGVSHKAQEVSVMVGLKTLSVYWAEFLHDNRVKTGFLIGESPMERIQGTFATKEKGPELIRSLK